MTYLSLALLGPPAVRRDGAPVTFDTRKATALRVAALRTNMADLLHADGRYDAAMTHLKEAARRFASVDGSDAPRPEIWTLVEW
jgi:hypothetical protein